MNTRATPAIAAPTSSVAFAGARNYLIMAFVPDLIRVMEEHGGPEAMSSDEAYECLHAFGEITREQLWRATTMKALQDWADEWNRLAVDNYVEYTIEVY